MDKEDLRQGDCAEKNAWPKEKDCDMYAWELGERKCQSASFMYYRGLSSLNSPTACVTAPPCTDTCSSNSGGCSLESLLPKQGFCLDNYPADIRERLITAIKSGNKPDILAILYEMFELTSEQRQICSTEWESRSGLSLDYGFVAPKMPEGTDPASDCFSQLPPKEQQYWLKEYQGRKNCGTWIHVREE